MEQYISSQEEADPKANHLASTSLLAQVSPNYVDLQWEDKKLKLPNPEYVDRIARMYEQLYLELQQLKTQHNQLQQKHAQLLKTVQQIQDSSRW